ncbi:hypothetical protein ANCDUO_04208 [Ancylostoma duodenale]|uniref:Uncharacterized protein n=1 Tax=Ancylostoma duodenale TaxID=51022 RepID=A0A0C2GVL3_9BILA|nr:hypothetical protein ANCDUO_04208 [Ancylostoma duodenale]
MLLSVDCARSRECSPSHSPMAMDTSAPSSSASQAEFPSHTGSSFVSSCLKETTGKAHDQPWQQSNVQLENSTPSVALVESLTPKPPSGTSPVTRSGTSSRKRHCRRKGTPLHFEKDTGSRCVSKQESSSPLKKISNIGAEEPNPSFGSTNQGKSEDKTNDQNEGQLTPTVSKRSAGRTPSSAEAPPKSTGTNSRKRKASSHTSTGEGGKHPRKGQEKTLSLPDSTPLCSKTSENSSPTEVKQNSATRGSSKKKPDVPQITPRTAEETPRCATARTSSARAKKIKHVIAEIAVENSIENSASTPFTTPSSEKRAGKRVNQATPKPTRRITAKDAKKKPAPAKPSNKEKTGGQSSKTSKNKKKSEDLKVKERAPQAVSPLVSQNSTLPSPTHKSPGEMKPSGRAKRSSSVDTGLKEDRRAMAAARIRNRQLTSGYYV